MLMKNEEKTYQQNEPSSFIYYFVLFFKKIIRHRNINLLIINLADLSL